jgi:hypothetical protein
MEELVMKIIERRMQELGFGNHYSIYIKHIVLLGNENREIEAYNQFYFLVKPADNVMVQSDFGFFDLSFPNTNEQDYEHQGLIILQNHVAYLNHVHFIQVIPNHLEAAQLKPNAV